MSYKRYTDTALLVTSQGKLSKESRTDGEREADLNSAAGLYLDSRNSS